MAMTQRLPAAGASVSRADCAELDRSDPLSACRTRFRLPEGEIYLDGNSLGALPASVIERLRKAVVDEWGTGLIRSWNAAGWYPAPSRAGDRIARLIGAEAGEVVVCDSTSVNLFKLLVVAARLRPDRRIIVSERHNFPTDLYVASGVAELLGLELRCVATEELEPVIAAAGEALAAVTLTQVNYRTGLVHDMAGLTERAHQAGALAVWDLSHSAGAMPVDLNGSGADLAVGCGYKYLNGGPGAPAFAFVARRHLGAVRQPLSGWLGHAHPFAFAHEYEPALGIGRMLVGTPPMLSLIALEEALAVFDDVDMRAVRAKSQAIGDLFIRLVEQELDGHGFDVASPRDAARRGSQVSLTHPEAYAIMQALIARGVIGDFRAPDLLRFGFAVLYVGYEDIWRAVQALRTVMERREWDRPSFQTRKPVT